MRLLFSITLLFLLAACKTNNDISTNSGLNVHDTGDRKYQGFIFLDTDNSEEVFESLNIPIAKPVKNTSQQKPVSSKLANALNKMPDSVTYYSSFSIDEKGRPFNIYIWSEYKEKRLAQLYADLIVTAGYEVKRPLYNVKHTFKIDKPTKNMQGPRIRMW